MVRGAVGGKGHIIQEGQEGEIVSVTRAKRMAGLVLFAPFLFGRRQKQNEPSILDLDSLHAPNGKFMPEDARSWSLRIV